MPFWWHIEELISLNVFGGLLWHVVTRKTTRKTGVCWTVFLKQHWRQWVPLVYKTVVKCLTEGQASVSLGFFPVASLRYPDTRKVEEKGRGHASCVLIMRLRDGAKCVVTKPWWHKPLLRSHKRNAEEKTHGKFIVISALEKNHFVSFCSEKICLRHFTDMFDLVMVSNNSLKIKKFYIHHAITMTPKSYIHVYSLKSTSAFNACLLYQQSESVLIIPEVSHDLRSEVWLTTKTLFIKDSLIINRFSERLSCFAKQFTTLNV